MIPEDGLGDSVGVRIEQAPPANQDNMRKKNSPTVCLTGNPSNHQSESNCQQVAGMEKEDG